MSGRPDKDLEILIVLARHNGNKNWLTEKLISLLRRKESKKFAHILLGDKISITKKELEKLECIKKLAGV